MSQYKILIADDEPEHIENLFYLLEKEDFKIFLATNGEKLFELTKKILPDLIITDWDMPVLSGIEASIKIREDEKTKNIPIIMATGKMLSLENLQTAFDAGVNDFITKPYNSFEVIARAKSMIRYYNSLKKTIEYEKQIAEMEIKSIASELTTAKMRTLQHNNFLDNIISLLDELKKYTNDTGKKILKQIHNKTVINKNTFNWDEFQTIFNKMNAGFVDKLNKLHPNLTYKEKRLIIFLKMGMSVKEIAAITVSNTDAVTKMKYRLKKKLNISAKSLSEYINSL